jgi:CHAT domain-containing protein
MRKHRCNSFSSLLLLVCGLFRPASAYAEPTAGPAAASAAQKTASLVAALKLELAALRELARLQSEHKNKDAERLLREISTRIATRLARPATDPQIALAIALSTQQLTLANSPVFRALTAAPPVQLPGQLEQEKSSIQAAASKSPAAAAPLISAITARIATRLGKDREDLQLYTAVAQAVQVQRVMGSMKSEPVLSALPSALRPTVDGSYTRGFQDLARVDGLLNAGKTDEAVQILRQNFVQTENLMQLVTSTGTSADSQSLLGPLDFQVDSALSVARRAPQHAGAAELAFIAIATRKAKLLEQQRRISAGLRQTSDAQVHAARLAWSALHSRISEIQFQRALGVGPDAAEQQELSQLQAREAQLQSPLARQAQSTRVGDAPINSQTLVRDLTAALSPGESLVSFARYEAKPAARYAAFVLDAKGLRFADLGDAAMLEGAIGAYVDALDRLDGSSASIQTKVRLANAVYRLALLPLESELKASTSLRVAADGPLQMLPFAALHDGKGWLANRFEISYLTSERDLLFEYVPTGAPSAPVVLAWSPQPGAAPSNKGQHLTPNDFPELKGVNNEASAVSALLPNSRLLTAAAASDETALKLASPKVLHVAAHGLFVGTAAGTGASRGLRLSAGTTTQPDAVPTLSATTSPPGGDSEVDPAIRSALVLAPEPSGKTDGFLTGYEVQTMDLFGTELAVLSACETGRGDPLRLQGVRGMRAAFFTAGVQSLVVSLWHVQDQATVDLMRSFYRSIEQHVGRRRALRDAMDEAKKRSDDPSTWAAFILLGRTGPLSTPGVASAAQAKQAAEIGMQRLARMIEHRDLGLQGSRGTGNWKVGSAEDALVSADVQDGLGPSQSNLKFSLVGHSSALSFLITGFHGPGVYAVGRAGARAGVRLGVDPVQTSPGELDPTLGMTPASDGNVVVTGGHGSSLSGLFTLRVDGKIISGSFQVR